MQAKRPLYEGYRDFEGLRVRLTHGGSLASSSNEIRTLLVIGRNLGNMSDLMGRKLNTQQFSDTKPSGLRSLKTYIVFLFFRTQSGLIVIENSYNILFKGFEITIRSTSVCPKRPDSVIKIP